MVTLLTIVHIVVCLFLILVVLLQAGKGGGMGIAFGALCLRVSKSLHGHAASAAGAFTLGDFRWAFTAAGMLVLVSLVGYARLPRDAGHEISGRS